MHSRTTRTRARLDSSRVESRRVEASRLRWPFFSRISQTLSLVLERALRAHIRAPRHGLRARFSFVCRASCRETGNNGGVRGEIKTAYGLFIFRRRVLRSWLSCAKSPLGVSRFISASRVYQPRAERERYIQGVRFLFMNYFRDFRLYFSSTTLITYFYLRNSANTLAKIRRFFSFVNYITKSRLCLERFFLLVHLGQIIKNFSF